MTHMMTDGILMNAKQLAAQLGLSTPTLWRMDAAGRLPRPLRLSRGTTRWRRSDIEQWVELGCPDRKHFEEMVQREECGR